MPCNYPTWLVPHDTHAVSSSGLSIQDCRSYHASSCSVLAYVERNFVSLNLHSLINLFTHLNILLFPNPILALLCLSGTQACKTKCNASEHQENGIFLDCGRRRIWESISGLYRSEKKHEVQKNILGWLKSSFQFFRNIQNELFGPPHIKWQKNTLQKMLVENLKEDNDGRQREGTKGTGWGGFWLHCLHHFQPGLCCEQASGLQHCAYLCSVQRNIYVKEMTSQMSACPPAHVDPYSCACVCVCMFGRTYMTT